MRARVGVDPETRPEVSVVHGSVVSENTEMCQVLQSALPSGVRELCV